MLGSDELLYLNIARKFLSSNCYIVDAGANKGLWTSAAFEFLPSGNFILFEPIQTLSDELKRVHGKNSRVTVENLALSNHSSQELFAVYEGKESFSGLNRRSKDIEDKLNLIPNHILVNATTLDHYLPNNGIRRVGYLKLDTEGSEQRILNGAKYFIANHDIDMIQIEYGETWLDCGFKLSDLSSSLTRYGYNLFLEDRGHLVPVPQQFLYNDTYSYCNLLALAPRIASVVTNNYLEPYALKDVASLHKTDCRGGVIHVGAHKGLEVKKYISLGYSPIVMVEANTKIWREASSKFQLPNVYWVNCASSDYEGSADLYVTSMDQSSSLLRLKRHSEFYPDIIHCETVTVPVKTLDHIVSELGLPLSSFSLLNIDVQGVENQVIAGAGELLKYVDIVYTEVNFDELYEGCSQIESTDELLERYGFRRHNYRCSYHHSWGDAIYTKKRVFTNTEIGVNGQFANQAFQIIFLDHLATTCDADVTIKPWPYSEFYPNTMRYSYNYPLISQKKLINITEEELIDRYNVAGERNRVIIDGDSDIDFSGYFQDASMYGSRESFLARYGNIFKLRDDISCAINIFVETILNQLGTNIICIHYRLGDYGNGDHFVTPPFYYAKAIERHSLLYTNPSILVVSDDHDRGQMLLLESSCNQEVFTIPALLTNLHLSKSVNRLLNDVPRHIVDFEIIRRMTTVYLSNSSFGYLACMLNERLSQCLRPSKAVGGLISVDLYQSTAILLESAPIPWFCKI